MQNEFKGIVLGAGKYQRVEWYQHQDVIPFYGVDFCFDLNSDQWPLMRNSYHSIIATHVVEHLKDLIHFMNKCHELLINGGQLVIETPNAGTNPDLEFCDPTHVRCYRPHTFINYFTKEGIEKFGYTDKEWQIKELKTFQLEVPDDTIRVVLTAVK